MARTVTRYWITRQTMNCGNSIHLCQTQLFLFCRITAQASSSLRCKNGIEWEAFVSGGQQDVPISFLQQQRHILGSNLAETTQHMYCKTCGLPLCSEWTELGNPATADWGGTWIFWWAGWKKRVRYPKSMWFCKLLNTHWKYRMTGVYHSVCWESVCILKVFVQRDHLRCGRRTVVQFWRMTSGRCELWIGGYSMQLLAYSCQQDCK